MVALDVFSDLICAWCYIGARRLQRSIDVVEERTGRRFHIRHRAFELNPTMPLDGMDRRSYRSAKFGSWQRAQQLDYGTVLASQNDGITFNYDAMATTPNTRAGHRLIALAEGEAGLGAAMADRLFAAYFSEGRDIGAVPVLAELGAQLGLGEDVATKLSDPALEAAVQQDQALAEQLGIHSVPLLIVGETAITGAVEAGALIEILEEHAGGVPAGATCEDGACSP